MTHKEINTGSFVRIHPCEDAFMMGETYGEVLSFAKEKTMVHVKGFRSNKMFWISLKNLVREGESFDV